MTLCAPRDVLTFWFNELVQDDWFKPSADVDAHCARRFGESHLALSRSIPDEWRATPDNRLAAILLLDQMPRNIYRGSPLAFATDGLALREARLAIEAGVDTGMGTHHRCFLYLPFEHSENLSDQTRAVALFTELGDANYLDFAIRHRQIIERFGRFPHRNAIVGRASTPAEVEFLSQPGSGF